MNTIEIRCTEGKQDYIAEMPDGEFTLIIEHPHPNPPFVYRLCDNAPTDQQAFLVSALSGGQLGLRSFTGRRTASCGQYYYLGWNVMGYMFDRPSCYCQCCGYANTTIAYATKIIASSKLDAKYLDELRFKCEKSSIELEVLSLDKTLETP